MQLAMKTKIVYSEKCLGYGTWHIEGPQRVKAAHDILHAKGYEFMEPTLASDEDILGIHDADYIFNVKKGLVEDSDTPAYKNIFEFAMLSVGGALLASKINGFSLMRPPGHHVGRSGAALGVYTRGFCYFNNIAIHRGIDGILYNEEINILSNIMNRHCIRISNITSGRRKICVILVGSGGSA